MTSEPGAAGARAPSAATFASTVLTRRLIVFVLCTLVIAMVMTNLVMSVPVAIPSHSGSEAFRYWEAAAVAAAIVLGSALAVAAVTARRLWFSGSRPVYESPPPLRFAVAPIELVVFSAGSSFSLFLIAIATEQADWITALAMLVPWLPTVALESVHRWRIDGFYALFLGVSLLQAGHLGEHSAQVLQLVIHDGNLDRSHGIFGQFDFETVHFWWDTAIWFVTAALLLRYWGNGWVWVSFAFASLHQMEHSYLYYVFLADFDWYMEGGLAGVMGKGGVIGSPFARPYLHFLYNFLVTTPMLIGLWSQQDAGAPNDATR